MTRKLLELPHCDRVAAARTPAIQLELADAQEGARNARRDRASLSALQVAAVLCRLVRSNGNLCRRVAIPRAVHRLPERGDE